MVEEEPGYETDHHIESCLMGSGPKTCMFDLLTAFSLVLVPCFQQEEDMEELEADHCT